MDVPLSFFFFFFNHLLLSVPLANSRAFYRQWVLRLTLNNGNYLVFDVRPIRRRVTTSWQDINQTVF